MYVATIQLFWRKISSILASNALYKLQLQKNNCWMWGAEQQSEIKQLLKPELVLIHCDPTNCVPYYVMHKTGFCLKDFTSIRATLLLSAHQIPSKRWHIWGGRSMMMLWTLMWHTHTSTYTHLNDVHTSNVLWDKKFLQQKLLCSPLLSHSYKEIQKNLQFGNSTVFAPLLNCVYTGKWVCTL